MKDVIKFGSVIVTPTLEQTQVGTTTSARHKLKAKKDLYFVGVCLGMMDKEAIRNSDLKTEIEERLNALGWFLRKSKKASLKRKKV